MRIWNQRIQSFFSSISSANVYQCRSMCYTGNRSVWHLSLIWGFPSMGVPPIAGWFLLEKIPSKWMMTGGSIISGHHISIPFYPMFVPQAGHGVLPKRRVFHELHDRKHRIFLYMDASNSEAMVVCASSDSATTTVYYCSAELLWSQVG